MQSQVPVSQIIGVLDARPYPLVSFLVSFEKFSVNIGKIGLFPLDKNVLDEFNRNGRKIGRYDKMWKTACRKAGLRGKLFHDLRRTAARNLVRSGIPEVLAIRLTFRPNRGNERKSRLERSHQP